MIFVYILYILLVIFCLPFVVMIISVLIGIPCLPTHKKQAKILIELCDIKPGTKLVDLGSGHGRLVMMAAEAGANVVGYELNPFLVLFSRWLIRRKGLSDRAKIRWQSLYKADIKEADVVTTFLFMQPMVKLAAGLFKQLKPGAKVVSYTFSIPSWQPIVQKEGISVYEKKVDN